MRVTRLGRLIGDFRGLLRMGRILILTKMVMVIMPEEGASWHGHTHKHVQFHQHKEPHLSAFAMLVEEKKKRYDEGCTYVENIPSVLDFEGNHVRI